MHVYTYGITYVIYVIELMYKSTKCYRKVSTIVKKT